MLNVKVFCFTGICDIQKLQGIASVLSGAVNFQFYTEVPVSGSMKFGCRFKVIVPDGLSPLQLLKAAFTVRVFPIIRFIVSIALGFLCSTLTTVNRLAVCAMLAKRTFSRACILMLPNPVSTLKADDGVLVEAIQTHDLSVKYH